MPDLSLALMVRLVLYKPGVSPVMFTLTITCPVCLAARVPLLLTVLSQDAADESMLAVQLSELPPVLAMLTT